MPARIGAAATVLEQQLSLGGAEPAAECEAAWRAAFLAAENGPGGKAENEQYAAQVKSQRTHCAVPRETTDSPAWVLRHVPALGGQACKSNQVWLAKQGGSRQSWHEFTRCTPQSAADAQLALQRHNFGQSGEEVSMCAVRLHFECVLACDVGQYGEAISHADSCCALPLVQTSARSARCGAAERPASRGRQRQEKQHAQQQLRCSVSEDVQQPHRQAAPIVPCRRRAQNARAVGGAAGAREQGLGAVRRRTVLQRA